MKIKFIYSVVRHLPLHDFFSKKWIDINECEENNTNVCNTRTERCENSEGSYLCICSPGFRKDNGICKGIPSPQLCANAIYSNLFVMFSIFCASKHFLILSIKLLHIKILTYRQTTFTDSICQEQHFCAEGFWLANNHKIK